jgi:hypothetical protein
LINATEEDKEKNFIEELQNNLRKEDAHIIHADEKRLQLFRHQPG